MNRTRTYNQAMRHLPIHLFCAALLLAAHAFGDEKEETPETAPPVSTSVQWKVGERFKCVIKDDCTSRTTAGEEVFELHSVLTLDTNWEITKALSDGGAAFTVGIERLRFKSNGDGAAAMAKDLTFDSSTEVEPGNQLNQGVASVLKRYIGPVARGRLDARGHIKFFSFNDEFSTILKEQTVRELGGFFSGPFAASGLRHCLAHWLVTRPPEALTKGTSWTQETISRGGPNITCKRSYEAIGEEDKNGAPHLKISISPEYVPKGGIRVAKQAGDGTVYLDNGTGKIREVSLQHEALMSTGYSDISIKYKYSANVTDSP